MNALTKQSRSTRTDLDVLDAAVVGSWGKDAVMAVTETSGHALTSWQVFGGRMAGLWVAERFTADGRLIARSASRVSREAAIAALAMSNV